MLCAIDDYSRGRARQILILLSLAVRDLTAAEIIEALAVDVDGQERYDPTRRLYDSADLARICPGLIDVVDLQRTGKIVRIAHFSVQEYLFSDRIRKGNAASFAISRANDHAQISKTCLIYLCHDDFLSQALTPQLVQQYNFAAYAAQYWSHHFRKSDEKDMEELEARIMILCTNKISFERWVRLCDMDEHFDTGKIRYPNNGAGDPDQIFAPVYYYLALLGLRSPLVKFLTVTKATAADVSTQGGVFGNALQAASSQGHNEAVHILLKAGAYISSEGGYYGSALQAACSKGHSTIVQILLKAGADVNAQGGCFNSALQAASMKGYGKIVQLLLDAGTDVKIQEEGGYGTALQEATDRGHDKVVRILKKYGATR